MMVSIVIPCYNSEQFVAQAVRSAFAQTHSPLEVIVVDDGSTDGSLALLRQLQNSEFPGLIVLQHEDGANHGVSSTRRRGAAAASGEFIALLDADDEFLPEKIERQLGELQAHPDVIMCHAAMQVSGAGKDTQALEQQFRIRPTAPYRFHRQRDFLKRNGIGCSSVLVKKAPLLEVPFASDQVFQHEDWLCWCLLSRRGRFIYLDEPLTIYRWHAGSATSALARNKLVEHYSKLELKLALAARAETFTQSLRALVSIPRTLAALAFLYGRDTIPSDSGTRRNGLYRALFRLRRMFGGEQR
jgi:glycosyltransferase involved in cell wall biosynthesis